MQGKHGKGDPQKLFKWTELQYKYGWILDEQKILYRTFISSLGIIIIRVQKVLECFCLLISLRRWLVMSSLGASIYDAHIISPSTSAKCVLYVRRCHCVKPPWSPCTNTKVIVEYVWELKPVLKWRWIVVLRPEPDLRPEQNARPLAGAGSLESPYWRPNLRYIAGGAA